MLSFNVLAKGLLLISLMFKGATLDETLLLCAVVFCAFLLFFILLFVFARYCCSGHCPEKRQFLQCFALFYACLRFHSSLVCFGILEVLTLLPAMPGTDFHGAAFSQSATLQDASRRVIFNWRCRFPRPETVLPAAVSYIMELPMYGVDTRPSEKLNCNVM